MNPRITHVFIGIDSTVRRLVLPSGVCTPVVAESIGKETPVSGDVSGRENGTGPDTAATVEYKSGVDSAAESLSSNIQGKKSSDTTDGQVLNTRGKASAVAASGSTRSVFGTGTHKTETAVKGSMESGTRGAVGSAASTAAGNSAVSENDKLKRIIANYEKDKAEQAKKQPALAVYTESNRNSREKWKK